MGRAKEIIVKIIPAKIANEFIKAHHYSRKVAATSKVHFGAFLDGNLHGVMSFGSSMAKHKSIKYVHDTGWNEFIELNRMAFDDYLPRNSESRCIGIAIRMIKKNAPHIKWIVSFADGTQCGDGTIYRASGFVLTAISKNKSIYVNDRGETACDLSYNTARNAIKNKGSANGSRILKEKGFNRAVGFQLRYIYLIDKSCKLAVPIIPFDKIKEVGAGMYKGKSK